MADTITHPFAAEMPSAEAGSTFTAVNKNEVKATPKTIPEAEVPTTPTEAPTTPSRRKSGPKKLSTPKVKKEPATPKKTPAKRGSDSNSEDTPKSAKRTKGTPSNDRKGIPTRVEDMAEEDKMLLEWRNVRFFDLDLPQDC
jgi:hypothetical protein